LLDLGYPGGPVIDKIAGSYKGEHEKFTPGLSNSKKNKYNFSYSGLKTAVLYHVRENPGYKLESVVKGFQIAAIKVLYEKAMILSKETGIKNIVIAGGVASNSYLRELFLNTKGVNIHLPDPVFCTDNGVMVACCAYYKSKWHKYDNLDFEV